MNRLKLSLNQQAIAGLAKVLVGLIVVAVVGYSEVMYLQIMARAFPDGVLKIVAMIGAVGTGLSVLTLLIAKSYWFRPGGQMVAAWLFTGVEVTVLILNVLLSFALDKSQVDGYLAVWYLLTPSSPLIALVGWILILHLDHTQQERHAELEMEVEMQQAERAHRLATHEARMRLREAFLHSHATYLEQEVNSPEIQRQLAMGASALAARELSALTGMHIAPRLAGPQLAYEQAGRGLPAGGQYPTPLPTTPGAQGMGADETYPTLVGFPLAAAPASDGATTTDSDEAWLARVNERIEQERKRRLAQETEPVTEVAAADGDRSARLARLVAAAEAHGYSLEWLERRLGVDGLQEEGGEAFIPKKG